MEIFEVLYRGKKVRGIKIDSNEIYVDLPTRKGEKGTEFKENISRDSMGWKFSSFAVANPEHNLSLWFRDDGKLACTNSANKGIFVTKEVFNPELQNAGKLNKIATELYGTIEELKSYENREIPASTIAQLRKFKLVSTLKLLGYPSIKSIEFDLDDSQCYFALSRVREQLKNYINLGSYIHLEGIEKPEDIIRVMAPKEMTGEEFIEFARPVKDEISSNAAFIKEWDEKTEQKRSVHMDYCAQASRKIPKYDWITYCNVVRKTAKLLLELNADLLGKSETMGVEDFSQLTEEELKATISKLINSKDFIKACDIENKFLLREAETLVIEINSILGDSTEILGKSPVVSALADIKREEISIIKKRKSKIQEQGIGVDD